MTEQNVKTPRVVMITGSNSGIGRLTALELARRGATVIASMRDTRRAGALQDKAAAEGLRLDIVPLDVRSEASVRAAVADVLERHGSIDVLLNNAAAATIGPLEFSSEQELTSIFDTNVMGIVRVTRAVLPSMRGRLSGRIVNVSSGSARARAGVRLLALYAASKAAVHTLTLELNKELAFFGIRAVLVEGGVGGPSQINDNIMKRVADFGRADAAYRVPERIATAQMQRAHDNLGDGMPAARMLADACLVADPDLRFPAAAQQALDWTDRLGDRDFLKLCALEDIERVLPRNGLSQSPWAIRE